MPKITEYNVPSGQARLRPSPDTYAAFETAARRIGPLFNQAGQDYSRIGRTVAESIKASSFPLDFAAFGESSGGSGRSTILQGGGSGSSHSGGGGASRAQNAHYPSTSSGRDRGGQAGDPVASAAKLIDGWGQTTKDVAPGVGVLRGGREPVSGDNGPSVITMHPGNKSEDDFSVAPRDYLADQVARYGVAPAIPLDPPPGYSAAPAPAADTAGGFWSGLGEAVSNAVSTAGAADNGAYTEGGF